MKFGHPSLEFDGTDFAILNLLQENCKQPLAAIGQKVGLSAPSVLERIHKLEEAGVITDYVARLDARRLGRDVAAFIGVATERARDIDRIERALVGFDDVLECHHVTGTYTLMLKVKTCNTETLEGLIERVRSLAGVVRTETMVVLSTHLERMRLALDEGDEEAPKPARRGGGARGRRGAR